MGRLLQTESEPFAAACCFLLLFPYIPSQGDLRGRKVFNALCLLKEMRHFLYHGLLAVKIVLLCDGKGDCLAESGGFVDRHNEFDRFPPFSSVCQKRFLSLNGKKQVFYLGRMAL